jgi:hypothetical protein
VARTVPNPLAAIGAYGLAALKAILAADSDLDLARGKLPVKHPKFSLRGARRDVSVQLPS